MVVNMIKWRPWLPLESKKFEVKIVIRSISGLLLHQKVYENNEDDEKSKGVDFEFDCKLKVEIRWKCSKINNRFKPLKKKGVKRSCTKEEGLSPNGVVCWDEEFKRVCEFSGSKEKIAMEGGVFHSWEVSFLVLHSSKNRSNKMVPLTAPAVLNLAEFASVEDVKEFNINVPLSVIHCGFNCIPSVFISLSLVELKSMKTTQEFSVETPKPILFAPLSPCFGASPMIKKDESPLKSSLREVKSLTHYFSSKRSKKLYHGQSSSDSKLSTGSEDSESNYPFDTDSFECTDEGEYEESKEDADVQKSCSYGTLIHANLAGGALSVRIDCEGDDLLYYSRHKPHVDSSPTHDFGTSDYEQAQRQSPKFGLSWTKGKLSFKTRRVKGEPLLKKDYGEEGGDDIDFYRRQFSFDEYMTQFDGSTASGSFISEFGDDNFAVGSWEQKELLSRDGSLKLQTQIFFASIDQRSERAAGESACTALVAVIANWLHSNQWEIPIKSEFDSLIQEGSRQWRNLCENEDYQEKFPDKHFDLETVIQAQICPLSVIPERSFIGFFHPDGLEQEGFDFLQGAMSFDNIWDEIYRVASEMNSDSESLVYVVSWNDHFFILRVNWDAYYIIDTLGERLYEGCKQAYILKFSEDTSIERLSSSKDGKSGDKESTLAEVSTKEELEGSGDRQEEEEKVVCRGKESCKEYIKSFLAAIPMRELQIDMKKGLMSSSTPLHHRLQIEFNYTKQFLFPEPPVEYIAPQMARDTSPLTAGDVPTGPTLTASDVQPSRVVDLPEPIVMVDFPGLMSAAEVPVSIMTVAVA